MKVLEIGTIELSEKNRDWFNRPGYEMTGETVKIGWDAADGSGPIRAASYIVFVGDWTRFDTVRDCGGHWIYAGWTGYIRIDKNTFGITYDVKDE